ncbi:beta-lactamase/transpeptidase-like protein [Lentinula raphanica]|nr:beta-lactamase/transpeptidase-like protein [Lentinula raphanica]
MIGTVLVLLSLLCYHVGCTIARQTSFTVPSHSKEDAPHVFLSPEIDIFIQQVLAEYNSPGLSVAVIRRNETYPTGWLTEFGSYGVAKADGSPVTPDSLFAIASNSKLFLAYPVGLLIENQTLAEQRGRELSWKTPALEIFPQWGLMDKDMERIVHIQDMLSHRTGMPRHDQSGRPDGEISFNFVSQMLIFRCCIQISKLRYLRPSAEVRETWQYNNLMYETLSYLPELLVGQAYESYIDEHIFKSLDMSASTYSVAAAEDSGNLAHGYVRSMRDEITGVNGTLIPTVPYFSRPGNEKIWAGAGGVITSARDLSMWMAMLLGNGKHPLTNATVIPEKLVKHAAEGFSVIDGAPSYPELGILVYGAGQERYTYRGHDLIEHGGSNPGFKTQVTRFPDDNLGIIVLSNDEEFGPEIYEIVIRRIADHVFGLNPIDWKTRYQDSAYFNPKSVAEKVAAALPRPKIPQPPTHPISSLQGSSFMHPAYGNSTLEDTLSIPTLMIPYSGFFSTHIMLRHFSGNLFNGSILWSNRATREKEGYHNGGRDDGDVITGFDDRFEVEWVPQSEMYEEGLAFKGGFWGKGKKAKSPIGTGKESAEVWFSKL